MTLKTLILTIACVASAVPVWSHQTLRDTGAFRKWKPPESVPFNYADGKYTLEIDFSQGTDFKITTTHLSGCIS